MCKPYSKAGISANTSSFSPLSLHRALCGLLPEGSFLYVAAEDIACPSAWLEPRGCWRADLLAELVRCFDLGSLTGLVQTSASPTWRAAPNFWAISTILCPHGKKKKQLTRSAEPSCLLVLAVEGGSTYNKEITFKCWDYKCFHAWATEIIL